MANTIKPQIIFFAVLAFLLKGCCFIPLMNCGPIIEKIKITPKDTTIFINGQETHMIFEGFNYYERTNKNKILTNIDLIFEKELKDNNKQIIEKSNIYYNNKEKKDADEINKLKNGYSVVFYDGLLSNQIHINFTIKEDYHEQQINLLLKIE